MPVNKHNLTEYIVQYLDKELSAADEKLLLEYISHHKEAQDELELLRKTILAPDETIIYRNKQALYRREEGGRVFKLSSTWVYAAVSLAAILLLFFLVMRPQHMIPQHEVAVKKPVKARNIPLPDSDTLPQFAHVNENPVKQSSTPQPPLRQQVVKEMQHKKFQVNNEIQIKHETGNNDSIERSISLKSKTFINYTDPKNLQNPVTKSEANTPNVKTKEEIIPANKNQNVAMISNHTNDDMSLTDKLVHFIKHDVSIKKNKKNEGYSYSINIDTKKIQVSKTLWANY